MRIHEFPLINLKVREDGKFWSHRRHGWIEGRKSPNNPYFWVDFKINEMPPSQRLVHYYIGLAFVPQRSPKHDQIDHIFSKGKNNKVTNLRYLSKALNNLNKTAKPLLLSIRPYSKYKGWRATVARAHLGYYKSEVEAQQIMDDYRQLLFYAKYKADVTGTQLRAAEARGDCFVHGRKHDFIVALSRLNSGNQRRRKLREKIDELSDFCT